MPSIAEIIQIAKVCQYLVSEKQADMVLYNTPVANPNLSANLYRIRKSVEWMYNLEPTYPTLTQVAFYLFGLCEYSGEALGIISGGGGGTPIAPVEPTGYEYTVLSFTVNPNYVLGVPVNGTNSFQNDAFIGALQFAYILADGIPETVQGGQVSLNSVTGVLTRVNTFFTGEIIIIPFLRKF